MRLFLALILYGLIFSSCRQQLPVNQKIPSQADTTKVDAQKTQRRMLFSIDEGKHVHGDPNARVPVVVFIDYLSAHSARSFRVLKELLADQQLKLIIRISFRHYPRGQESIKAAKAALASGLQGKHFFWRMSQKLFDADGEIDDSIYIKAAQEIGLDSQRFSQDMLENESKFMHLLRSDATTMRKVRNVAKVGEIFVGGHIYRGPMKRASLKRFIMAVKNYNERAISPSS
ncbi:MAG: thioredoxin domain-containing protein [Myxococcales bacterium]|nr:thioredoxin domain-containing protein [Myxococcales bacterium]USN50193.1 MAG: thioredoxin domain-containing protein [Myxococcales bacterium]